MIGAAAGLEDRKRMLGEIEALLVKSVREHLKLAQPIDDRTLVNTHVSRIQIQSNEIAVHLIESRQTAADGEKATADRELLVLEGVQPQHVRPIRSENRATLVASIARGRRWLDELTSDATANTESIAKRENCSVRKVNMTMSLAFLAPDLVRAAIEGRLPHGMGVTRLADLPVEWSRQHHVLGLPAQ
jgi:hypothetical protein